MDGLDPRLEWAGTGHASHQPRVAPKSLARAARTTLAIVSRSWRWSVQRRRFKECPPLTAADLLTKALQRYWRLSRGLTLGAQGVVIAPDNRVLLIRHTYRPGWHFPGGGVERGETVVDALTRELAEEAGILLDGQPELFGLYANERFFRGDHIALFVVRAWRQPVVPGPNREIAAQGFFTLDALPADTHPPTRIRLSEILEGQDRAQHW